MKIALQFYGFSRFYKESFPFSKILFDNYDVDVFIHTWDTIRYKHTRNTENLDIDDMVSMYKPTGFVAEPYDDYRDIFLEKAKWMEDIKQEVLSSPTPQYPDPKEKLSQREFSVFLRSFSANVPDAFLSMWYKWSQVSKLKHNYELKNGFTYDCVIHTRTDYKVDYVSIDFRNIVEINTPPWNSGDEPYVDYTIGLNDWWTAGPSKDMDVYCSVYDNLEIIRDYCLSNPEKYSGVYIGSPRLSIIKEVLNPHVIPVINLDMNCVTYNKNARYGSLILNNNHI